MLWLWYTPEPQAIKLSVYARQGLSGSDPGVAVLITQSRVVVSRADSAVGCFGFVTDVCRLSNVFQFGCSRVQFDNLFEQARFGAQLAGNPDSGCQNSLPHDL